jgi:ATP-dependent protease Clp ATPase subunit
MTVTPEFSEPYACAFCGKRIADVALLIASRQKVCICDECIVLCHDILLEQQMMGKKTAKLLGKETPQSALHT